MNQPFTVTLLTPIGRGAVATISLTGPASVEAVNHYFRPSTVRSKPDFRIGRILVGHWQSSDSAAEEVVVCRRSEECVEVNCHGGQAACQAILASLERLGGEVLSPSSWLDQRDLDRVQRAAWLALSNAATPRATAVLLDQFRGAFKNQLKNLLQLFATGEAASAEAGIRRILSHARLGLHLTHPFRIVVAGPPNVGKSSLVNALLGYQRAIVFDQPGTTRDVLTAMTALDGWPSELVDTAGLRDTSDAVEAEGVWRARSEMGAADLVLLVTDRETANDDIARRQSNEQTVLVANKADLGISEHHGEQWIRTSAVTGFGLQELMQTMVRRLVPNPPDPGEAVPFTQDQVVALQELAQAITEGNRHGAEKIVDGILHGNSEGKRPQMKHR